VKQAKRDFSVLSAAIPRAARAISSAGHRHALIGGVAVGVWVEPRATKDIDFVVSATGSELETLLQAAEAAGFEVRRGEIDRLKLSHMTRI
jgi:hypothetical protein